jgi:PD-(D/E)XK nuclease superfamily
VIVSSVAFGPQYAGDDPVTRRIRFHQSWWRVERLGAPAGVDARGNTYGNYLTEADASAGLNFLTPDIHQCALNRIASGGGVEKFRCTRNLLSSQPMAFNLFAPLHDDPDLAARLLDPLLPGGVATASVDIEWAPSKKMYLRDATSFDVVARYVRADGQEAIAGIETKLTEPFSQKTYGKHDHRTDRYREVARESNAWRDPDDPDLTDKRWNQVWRNQLLVESVRQRQPGLLGCEIVVHHPLDERCANNVNDYARFLTDPAETLGRHSLDSIVAVWEPLVHTDTHRRWLRDFADRYLNLHLSEAAWNGR